MYNDRVAILPRSAALLPQWLNERSFASTPCPSSPSASNGPLTALKMLARSKHMRAQPPVGRPAAFSPHGALVEGNQTFPAASGVYGPQPTVRPSALGAGEHPSARWMPSFAQMPRRASTPFLTVPWARCKAIAAAVARMFRGFFIPKAASAWGGQATSPMNAPARGVIAPFPKDGRADGPNGPFQSFGVPRWKDDTASLDEDEPFPSLQQPHPAKMLLCSEFLPPEPRSEEVDWPQAHVPDDASKERWKISTLRPQQGRAASAKTPPVPPSSTLKHTPVNKPLGQRSQSASPSQASLPDDVSKEQWKISRLRPQQGGAASAKMPPVPSSSTLKHPPVNKPLGRRSQSASLSQANFPDDVSKEQWKGRILPPQERSVPVHRPLTETRRNVYQPQLAPSVFSADQETD